MSDASFAIVCRIVSTLYLYEICCFFKKNRLYLCYFIWLFYYFPFAVDGTATLRHSYDHDRKAFTVGKPGVNIAADFTVTLW